MKEGDGVNEVRFQKVVRRGGIAPEWEALEIWVDGRPLRKWARDAELHSALAEGNPQVAGLYAGLPPEQVLPPSAHFLGSRESSFFYPEEGKSALLGCECGIVECWPLLARITVEGGRVTWSDFEQPHRGAAHPGPWRYTLGPFVFARDAYERALRDAATLPFTEDPVTRHLRLLPLDDEAFAAIAGDEAAFEARYGVRLGPVAGVAREAAAQNADLHRRVPRPAPWGAYLAVDDDAAQVVGTCAFPAAPDAEAAVEIAYFTFPPFEGAGAATDMARALVEIAAEAPGARSVIAHTLPETSASTRVLERNGFRRDGEAVDPDAGPVWRWRLDLPPR
ncbi:MAG TPA: GNAT family N-acetyltransferase [Longimicrobium sp.]|nr:GNAT family N-acetyltransferase [Longimicrobium sp.]